MFNDVDHPNVALSDWRAFTERQKICKPLSLIDEVIDRSQLSLPDKVFPLARGGAIASASLLRKAGYRSGTRQSQCWRRVLPGVFELPLDTQFTQGIAVRKIGSLWMVGRWRGTPLIEDLVFRFGSTPVFTRDCPSAKQLAWYCFHNRPPGDLCWVRSIPKNCERSIEFARRRAIDEAGCLAGGRHGPLH